MNELDNNFWDILDDWDDDDELAESVPASTSESTSNQIEASSVNKENVLDKLRILENRKKKLEAQMNNAERKLRNRKLFRLGLIIEKVLGRPIKDEDLKNLEIFLYKLEKNNNSFSTAMNTAPNNNKDN